jgi:hypothetical protein
MTLNSINSLSLSVSDNHNQSSLSDTINNSSLSSLSLSLSHSHSHSSLPSSLSIELNETDEVENRNKSKGTQYGYFNYIKRLASFLLSKEEFQSYVIHSPSSSEFSWNSIKLPLPYSIINSYFKLLTEKVNEEIKKEESKSEVKSEKKIEVLSYQTVSQNKSALLHLYEKNKYNELTTGFKQTLPYLVASIVYHIDFFKKNLNENHPFFQSLLFTRNFIHENKLKEKIETGNFNNTKTNMRATGLPPYMLMAQEIVSLKDTVGSLQNKLQQSLSQLPTEVTNSILNKCQINGAIPIVASDFKAFEDRFEQRIRSQIDEIKQSVSVTAINNNLMDVVHPPNEPDFDWHYWKEAKEYHMIPENWTAPTGMYCKEMWFLWNHGNKEKRIAPLRRLKSSIIPVKKNKNNFIKIQGVMKKLIKKSGLEPMDISDKTIAESGEIFDNSYQSLIKDLRPILSRRTTDRYTGKWKIATVYKHIRKLKRKQENKQYKPRKKRRTEENK